MVTPNDLRILSYTDKRQNDAPFDPQMNETTFNKPGFFFKEKKKKRKQISSWYAINKTFLKILEIYNYILENVISIT